MSDDGRFDAHAQAYNATVQRAIGASGESVQYFADLKVQLMSRALGAERPAAILDFGCGIGNATRALATELPEAQVTGVDESDESLAVARSIVFTGSERTQYVLTGDDRLPFADGAFAAAFTSCVFHHIDRGERVRWARELRRVISPGGSLFLFEHNPYNPLTRRVVSRVPFDQGVSLLTPRDAVQLLRDAGFAASPPWFYFFFPAFMRALRRFESMMNWVPIGAQYFVVGK